MRETQRVVSLASALAALVAPSAAPPIAYAASAEGTQASGEIEGQIPTAAEAVFSTLSTDSDLMSFTVHQSNDGTLFPQHGSHVSHSSHASHSSHLSHVSGIGIPSGPDIPSPQSPPAAQTTPPTTTTSTSPTSTPAPAQGSDPRYLACNWASNGRGVTEIANEIERRYGLPEAQAASIAEQALVSVLAGSHYCDGYLPAGQ